MCEDYKTQYEMYVDLLKTSCELNRFLSLQKEALMWVLDELESMTTDPLVKWVCKNARERAHLDQLIHNRTLFPNPEWFKWTKQSS